MLVVITMSAISGFWVLIRLVLKNYQITLGGDGTETATIGERTGPGFAASDLVPAIEAIIATYLELRLEPEETFLAAYRRLGADPFKAAIYVKEDDNVAA